MHLTWSGVQFFLETSPLSLLRVRRQMGFIYSPLAGSLTTVPKCFTVSKHHRALASDFEVIILRVKVLVLRGGAGIVRGQGGSSGPFALAYRWY